MNYMEGLFEQSLLNDIAFGKSLIPKCDFTISESWNKMLVHYKNKTIAEVVSNLSDTADLPDSPDLLDNAGIPYLEKVKYILVLLYSEDNDLHKLFCETFNIKPFSYIIADYLHSGSLYAENHIATKIEIPKNSVNAYATYFNETGLYYSYGCNGYILIRGKYRIMWLDTSDSNGESTYKYCLIIDKLTDDLTKKIANPEILTYCVSHPTEYLKLKPYIGDRTKYLIITNGKRGAGHVYTIINTGPEGCELVDNWELFVADYYSCSKKRFLKTKHALKK